LKSRYGLEIRAATVADAAGLSALFGAAGLTITPLALAGRLDAIRQDQGAVLIAAEWGPPSGLIILHWYRTLEADLSIGTQKGPPIGVQKGPPRFPPARPQRCFFVRLKRRFSAPA
jgi:aminoglycoside 6'-N-acetyltransferase I